MTGSTNVLVGYLSVFSCLLFCVLYKKLDGEKIGFPIYIYFAMFPHKLRALSFFSADDTILKIILLVDIFLILASARKSVKYNLYEIIFFVAVLIADFIAWGKNPYFFGSDLAITGIINIAFLFVFSFGFRNRVVDRSGMTVIFNVLMINGALLSFGALVEHYGLSIKRAELGMGNPNYLAFYLSVAFCLFFYRMRRWSIITMLYGALLVVGVLCTGSYSILLCFPIFVLLKLFYRILSNKKTPALSKGISFGLLLTALAIIVMASSEKMLSIPVIKSVLDDKDTSRLYVWQEAIEDVKSNFFNGVGYNYWRSRYGVGYVTHNDFLRILVETGIVGFGALLIYWWNITSKICKSKVRNQPMYMSLLLVLVIFSCFHNNINSLLFWIVLSLPLYDDIISV